MGLPVMVVAIICIFGVAIALVATVITVKCVRRRRAFRQGVVPAKMLLKGHYRYSKRSGKETGWLYALKGVKVIKRDARTPAKLVDAPEELTDSSVASDSPTANNGSAREEDCCPICLKPVPVLRTVIELGCTHQLCEKCFYRLIEKERLHTRCVLCRVLLFESTNEDGSEEGCCRGPLPGELESAMYLQNDGTRVPAHSMIV